MKLVLLSVLTIFGFSSGAMGQIAVLPQVKIEGLSNHVGDYITVYFALGTPASIVLSSEQINLREVRAKTTTQITSSSISTPRMSVAIEGFTVPFNVLLVVIHRQPTFIWLNANGTLPLGEEAGSTHHRPILVKAMLKSDVEQSTQEGVVKITLE